jgi:hypothetical protein
VLGMIRWLLRQDAASVGYVIVATLLLTWFAWTFL